MIFNSVLQAAKFYRGLGWSVVPVPLRGKIPSVSWKEYQTKAPTNQEITSWFGGKSCNIAAITGQGSGLTVIDADGEEGLKSAGRLGLSSPVVCKTGRGKHFYFKGPVVSNSVKVIAPGVDVRSEGGIVLLPPSIHESGAKYRWLSFSPKMLGEASPSLFQERKEESFNTPGWISQTLLSLKEGNRNDTFTRVVGRLHYDGWKKEDILALLVPHANFHSFPREELESIVESITARQGKDNSQGYKPLSLRDMLNQKAVSNWLVPGVIPQPSITILGGLPGIGKSLCALDMVLEFASESPSWLGFFPMTKRRVLYIDEESAPIQLCQRLNSMKAAKGEINLEGINFLVGENIKFTSSRDLAFVKETINNFRPDVVFLDSLVRMHDRDENSSTAMAQFFSILRSIVNEFGVSFFIVDHENKSAYYKGEEEKQVSSMDLRGSNEKAASADCVFNLRKKELGLVLYHTKSRWAEAHKPVSVRIVGENGGLKLSGCWA